MNRRGKGMLTNGVKAAGACSLEEQNMLRMYVSHGAIFGAKNREKIGLKEMKGSL